MSIVVRLLLFVCLVFAGTVQGGERPGIVALQTDYGIRDQAVAALHGVIRKVDRDLVVEDLTHEISAFNIWEAAYRLNAVIDYWPTDTVFVSVVDPGVGTSRKSVVLRLKTGQLIVTPDNGTLTLVAERFGIDAVREIDETRNRLPGSEGSYTFHGRDVYSYVAALLASGRLAFADVGPLQNGIVTIAYEKARFAGTNVVGGIPVLDPQFGNVWTNIPIDMFASLKIGAGNPVKVTIRRDGAVQASLTLPYVHTFGDVPLGQPLLYVNSVGNVAIALNQGDFAAAYRIASGPDWSITIAAAKAE